jgi:hypothetical protein
MDKIATPVVADKFWIVRVNGRKTGVLRKNEDGELTEFIVDTNESVRVLESDFKFEKKTAPAQATTDTVFGFPALPLPELFNKKMIDELPTFTKTANSSAIFCAGYFALKFQGGWTQSLCPKKSTLSNYEWKGPFKTKSDLTLTIKRLDADK